MARSLHHQPAVPDAPMTALDRDIGTPLASAQPASSPSARPVDEESHGLRGAARSRCKLFDLRRRSRRSIAAFVIFCALSGVVYLVNDVMDRESDRRHPLEAAPADCGRRSAGLDRRSPPPSSSRPVALAGAFALGWRFGVVATVYLGAADALLGPAQAHRHHRRADDCRSASCCARSPAPSSIDVVISHWLFVCTILLALFIALAKRRHELVLLADGATSHRPILGEYSAYLLDQMIAVVTASTLIAYIFYTISPETEQKFGTSWLGLTIPFPLYGIFRYLYLVHRREGGGSPADLLLNDRPLLACVTLWVVAVVLIIYHPFVP